MTAPEFKKFPKLSRLGSKKDQMIITEKIDGTNAQICIDAFADIYAGSRNRWIYPGKLTDNYGFAAWVKEHEEELLELGPGTWYGEWWGQGIQRRYDKDHREFSIFNTSRPAESLPDIVGQVPVLYTGAFDTVVIEGVFQELWDTGSLLCNHWVEPEGIVVYHCVSRQSFKMTYDYKNGKWGDK